MMCNVAIVIVFIVFNAAPHRNTSLATHTHQHSHVPTGRCAASHRNSRACPALRRLAAHALANLSVNSQNQELMAAEGAVEMLLDLLDSGNEVIQRQAAKAIANLSVNHANKLRIGQIGGIAKLVRLAGSHTLQVKVEAIAALGNLAVNDYNELEIVKQGALMHLASSAALAAQRIQVRARAPSVYVVCSMQAGRFPLLLPAAIARCYCFGEGSANPAHSIFPNCNHASPHVSHTHTHTYTHTHTHIHTHTHTHTHTHSHSHIHIHTHTARKREARPRNAELGRIGGPMRQMPA